VGDHLRPLIEPGVVFTTPPLLQQAWKVGLICLIHSFVSVFSIWILWHGIATDFHTKEGPRVFWLFGHWVHI
jgi:hypothetical protein